MVNSSMSALMLRRKVLGQGVGRSHNSLQDSKGCLALAIAAFPKVFNGGLVRGEHRPAPAFRSKH